MVDLERVDRPVSVDEGRGVVLDEILTRRGFGAACRVGGPDVAGPVTAESGVEDDLMILEELVDVATTSERRQRSAPVARIGISGSDVRGDAGAREEPNGNGRAGPLGRVHAPLTVVEAGAVGVALGRHDRTACVGGLPRSIDVAVGCGHRAGEVSAALGDATPRRCVQGHRVAHL